MAARPRLLTATSIALAVAIAAPAPVRAAEPDATAAPTAVEPTAPAEPPAADPGERGTVRAELVIEAELGDASALIIERATIRGEALLRQREVLPARGADGTRIIVRVAPIGDEPGYRCQFGGYRGTEVIADSDGVSLCKLCTEQELIDHIEAAIERVVPKLPAEAPAPRVAPTTASPASARRVPLAPLGKAGVAVTVLGAAGLVAGAVLVAQPQPQRDGDAPSQAGTSYRMPGVAVLAIGAGALVAGVVMLAVERRRARGSADEPRAAWRPTPLSLRF